MPTPREQLVAQIRALRPPDLDTRGLDPLAVRTALEAFAPPIPVGLDVREVDLLRDLDVTDPRYDDEDAVFLPAEWVLPRGGLPPLLQVGDAEVLLDDSVRLAERARAAGVDVSLEIFPELFHVFQAFGRAARGARRAGVDRRVLRA